jgi:probable rRNA maturation factor
MILIDPQLEPRPAASLQAAIAPLSLRRGRAPWAERIPAKQTLERFLSQAQSTVRLRGQVTVLLTTDAVIRRLSRRFRGKNRPTDVLSFPTELLQNAKSAERVAGDLAISVPTARRQAAELGHALTCELKVLILHGLLHLAGYDHETDSGQMHRRERSLRAQMGLPLGLIERTESESASQRVGKSARRRKP